MSPERYLNYHRNKFKITSKRHSIVSGIIIFQFILYILIISTIHAQTTRVGYYDFELNVPITQSVTDGTNEVNYIFTIINTGNQKDTYTLYLELLEVTSCDEPEPREWEYGLDKTIATLEPSFTEPFKLTVKSACTCQEGCIAKIAITVLSELDNTLKTTVYFNTTRGPSQLPPGDPGLTLSSDYEPEYDELFLDKENIIDISITSTQNSQDNAYISIINSPENWTTSITPEDLLIYPHTVETLKLKFRLPQINIAGIYKITILAQSSNNPNINNRLTINIPIKSDIIIRGVEFSKTTLRTNEEVKLMISIENIGLAYAEDIDIILSEEFNYTTTNLLKQFNIKELQPNNKTNLIYTWEPESVGSYIVSIQLDPKGKLDESHSYNNIRREPVDVKSGTSKVAQNYDFYYVYILIFVLILIWLVIYIKYSKRTKSENITERPNKVENKK